MTELTQATQFLHENGILLHYDDVNLQDYYFLDPQWLCDILAGVVTIREINCLAKSGHCHSLSSVQCHSLLYCYLCQQQAARLIQFSVILLFSFWLIW